MRAIRVPQNNPRLSSTSKLTSHESDADKDEPDMLGSMLHSGGLNKQGVWIVAEACKVKDALFIGNVMTVQDTSFIAINKIGYCIKCQTGFNVPQNLRRVGVTYTVMNLLGAYLDQKMPVEAKDHLLESFYMLMETASEQGVGVLLYAFKDLIWCCFNIIAYWMRKYRWTVNHAVHVMKSRRPTLQLTELAMSELDSLAVRLSNQKMEEDMSFEEERMLTNTYSNARRLSEPDETSPWLGDAPSGKHSGGGGQVRPSSRIQWVSDHRMIDYLEPQATAPDSRAMKHSHGVKSILRKSGRLVEDGESLSSDLARFLRPMSTGSQLLSSRHVPVHGSWSAVPFPSKSLAGSGERSDGLFADSRTEEQEVQQGLGGGKALVKRGYASVMQASSPHESLRDKRKEEKSSPAAALPQPRDSVQQWMNRQLLQEVSSTLAPLQEEKRAEERRTNGMTAQGDEGGSVQADQEEGGRGGAGAGAGAGGARISRRFFGKHLPPSGSNKDLMQRREQQGSQQEGEAKGRQRRANMRMSSPTLMLQNTSALARNESPSSEVVLETEDSTFLSFVNRSRNQTPDASSSGAPAQQQERGNRGRMQLRVSSAQDKISSASPSLASAIVEEDARVADPGEAPPSHGAAAPLDPSRSRSSLSRRFVSNYEVMRPSSAMLTSSLQLRPSGLSLNGRFSPFAPQAGNQKQRSASLSVKAPLQVEAGKTQVSYRPISAGHQAGGVKTPYWQNARASTRSPNGWK